MGGFFPLSTSMLLPWCYKFGEKKPLKLIRYILRGYIHKNIIAAKKKDCLLVHIAN